MKLCSHCKIEKDLSEYYRNPSSKDGLRYVCKPCARKQYKEYYPTRGRDSQLKRTYGITLSQRNELIEQQEGKCKICKVELAGGKHTHIDHDHNTGRIRGILCNHCNVGIGMFKNDKELVHKIIEYLS
jgi:hypothetical protein